MQDGNDFWNATFFCGSCAVLRRTALDEIGGIAVETVTEDAHTSLRMQMNGWNTAYINIPQAAGLATERLERARQAAHSLGARHDSDHADGQSSLRQGAQAARRESVLLSTRCRTSSMRCRGLSFSRAPLIYLHPGPGECAGLLGGDPCRTPSRNLILSSITNSRIQGAAPPLLLE